MRVQLRSAALLARTSDINHCESSAVPAVPGTRVENFCRQRPTSRSAGRAREVDREKRKNVTERDVLKRPSRSGVLNDAYIYTCTVYIVL